jgi:hypothetical protein
MGRMDFDKMNEAFRAGNRARKKESVQDTVESVNLKFKEQTDKDLEIRDGRLYYKGWLNLENNTKLTSLPSGLVVKGWLDLTGCTNLTLLPDNLTVGAGLDLRNCTGLTSLPDDLIVGSDIILKGCTNLKSLPAELTVNNLDLTDCTGLTSLPDNLNIKGSLTLTNCTNLTSLPAGLTVGSSLILRGCTGLTSLPENLTVKGPLDLTNCSGLTSLPAKLTVGKYLSVIGTNITSLPIDLKIKWGGIISHNGLLIDFFNKLGIKTDKDEEVTKALVWIKWQKSQQINEAFRAGNRARKKESVSDAAADMHNPLQDQIDRFRE